MLIRSFGISSEACWEQEAITCGKALQYRWSLPVASILRHVFLLWNTCSKKTGEKTQEFIFYGGIFEPLCNEYEGSKHYIFQITGKSFLYNRHQRKTDSKRPVYWLSLPVLSPWYYLVCLYESTVYMNTKSIILYFLL